MKTDRELLELAARAAGLELIDKIGAHFIVNEYLSHGLPSAKPWNPLDDDGDALRLTVKLRIDLLFDDDCNSVIAGLEHGVRVLAAHELDESGTRRAIVRAAAAIGDSIK